MKILIAVGSKEFSGPTLQVGMKVAKAFNASTREQASNSELL